MQLVYSFEDYKAEIELMQAQNPVECELYSVVACVIRRRADISLRDVSTRRTTQRSSAFKSGSGFPDFVVLTRDRTAYKVLGAVEIKRIVVYPLAIPDESTRNGLQILGHIDSFGEVLYTNGLEWKFYELNNNRKYKNPKWTVTLGSLEKNVIVWAQGDEVWADLMEKIDNNSWVNSEQ